MRTKLFYLTLTLILLSATHLFAADIAAEGFGKTESEARANAASELSFVIYSDVRSELHTVMSDNPQDQQQIVTKQVDVTSAIPLYGAEYTFEQSEGLYKCKAKMSADKSIPVYVKEIDAAVAKVNQSYNSLKSEKSASAKYTYVMSALSDFENIQKLKAVVNVLGGESKAYPDTTIEELQNLRAELTLRTDSMPQAAKLIAQELKKANVYVYYPMYNGSDEVTQFSSAFRDMLSAGFKSADSAYGADYFLETVYTVSAGGIQLSSTITDKSGVTLGKSVKILEPKAYAGLAVEPQSLSFEKLLKLGLAKSADFSARITASGGKRAMLYKSGDAVELFVKLNKPGYFFIVGHVDKAGERFSYIVDFYNTQGDRKFIRHVDADEINRWISIGEFDIVPPYGLETFQMIATVKDPVDMIPAHVFDPETELYIVSKDIKEGVKKTRALKLRPENKDAAAEDVLVFSTTEK